jgi:hypothetical protein
MKIKIFLPARLVYDSLDTAKEGLKGKIEGAKLISDVDNAAKDMGSTFDSAIAAEVKAAEESNSKIEEENKTIKNKKDKKPTADVAALRTKLEEKKTNLISSLEGIVSGKKIALTSEAKQAAERLAGEVAQVRLDIEQQRRSKEMPDNQAQRIYDKAGLVDSDFANKTSVVSRGDTGVFSKYEINSWGEDEAAMATRAILQAIYIEQGEDAALAKAQNLKDRYKGKSVFDLDQTDLGATFGDGSTPIDLEKRDEKNAILKDNSQPDLTGLCYGFYYTSGDTFNGDETLIKKYKAWLREEAAGITEELDAAGDDPNKRQEILAKIKSPSQWAMENEAEKFKGIKGDKETGKKQKDMKDYKDPEEYTRGLVASIPDVKLRDRMQNILVGAVQASTNKEDWPVIAEKLMKDMGIDPTKIGEVNAATLNKFTRLKDFKFGDLDKDKVDPWIREYIDGLLMGAEDYWKEKEFKTGGEKKNFMEAYRKYLEDRFKSGTALQQLAEVQGTDTDEKGRDRRTRLWVAMRGNILTPAGFFADKNETPETHEKGYTLIDEHGAVRYWDGEKFVYSTKRDIGEGQERWDSVNRQWVKEDDKKKPAAQGRRATGGSGSGASQPPRTPGSGTPSSAPRAADVPVAKGPEATPEKKVASATYEPLQDEKTVGTYYESDYLKPKDVGLTPAQEKAAADAAKGKRYVVVTAKYEGGKEEKYVAFVTDGQVAGYHRAKPETPPAKTS